MKRVITDEHIAREHAAGRRSIAAPRGEAIVTPGAWSKARELGVHIEDGTATDARGAQPGRGASDRVAPPKRKRAALDKGEAERVTDPSGVVVVRGRSVRLGTFPTGGAAHPERAIGLTDLIGGEHGSPMTAGIMSFSHDESFPWQLGYDEIDMVLEGVLTVDIDGRRVEGRAGDVLYIPKGSKIVFGTPSRTRVFYVTYPAEWAPKTT